MRRFLFVLLLNVLAMAALTHFVGGTRGPGSTTPDPEVDESAELRAPEERIVPPGPWPLAIHGAQGVWLPTDPEPVTVTDAQTGESVLVPDFERYTFQAVESRPVQAGAASHQAAEALGVKVHVYREPRTLDEARALIQGLPDAKLRLLKWGIEAPVAAAEFLQEGLSVTERRKQASVDEALIVLSGGVRIHDYEEGIVVDGEEIELEPGLGLARGRGMFVVRHPSFELTGEDLELSRSEEVEQVVIRRDAYVELLEELQDADGKPLLDLGGEEFRPGFVRAEGGARIVREKAFGRERLQIVLEDLVHAEQEGGRTLDAERVTIVAWRPVSADESEDWQLERFVAEGGAVLQYPQIAEDGTPLLVSLRGERLVHVLDDDGTATTLMEGRPHVDLLGDLRLRGFGGGRSVGLLSATAKEEAWVGLPHPGELPPGEDPAEYLRLVLHGGARLERRGAGADRDWDRIEGEQLTVLFRRTPQPIPEGAPEGTEAEDRLVACSFDLLGDVTLSGTRMSGHTHHLFGERLDTASPVIVAEGPNTDLRFHGIRSGERMLGGNRDARVAARPEGPAPPPGTAGETATKPESREWVLERLRAVGQLDIRTSLGGPTVGLPALLEGEELAYDRMTDRARLQGGPGTPARAAVGDPAEHRHTLTSRTMSFERGPGIVRAEGDVQGELWVTSGVRSFSGLSALGLGEPEIGEPAVFRVATNGRIEIRALLAQAREAPRPDMDQVLRIEGDVLAQLISDTKAIDQLRAQTVEVALRQVAPTDAGGMSAPLARAPTRRATAAAPTPPPEERAAEPVRRVRWDLEAEALSARMGDEGLLGVEALEGAVLRSEDGEIRGRRIAYDARLKEAIVQGSPELQAQAIFGQADARNEVWSPAMSLKLGDAGAERLVAAQPAWAVLIRHTKTDEGPRWERFEAACDAPVVVTPSELRCEGRQIEIQRMLRTAAGAKWEAPAHLWALRLVVQGTGLLSGEGAQFDRVIASGPATHFRMGEGDSLIRLWGQTFDLDVATSLATLTGSPDRKLRVRIGPENDPKADSEHREITLDLKSGMIRDMKLDQLILRGGAGR